MTIGIAVPCRARSDVWLVWHWRPSAASPKFHWVPSLGLLALDRTVSNQWNARLGLVASPLYFHAFRNCSFL